MPKTLIGYGESGRERGPSNSPKTPDLNTQQLRELLLDKKLLYYWATEPDYWVQREHKVWWAGESFRRFQIAHAMIDDLKGINPSDLVKERFWSAYSDLSKAPSKDIEVGPNVIRMRLDNNGLRLSLRQGNVNLENAHILSNPSTFDKKSLPIIRLDLNDPHPNLLHIINNRNLPTTGAVVFTRLARSYIALTRSAQ